MSASTFLSGSPATVVPVLSVRQYLAAGATIATLADARIVTTSVLSCVLLNPTVGAAAPLSISTPTIVAGSAIVTLNAAVTAGGYAEVQWSVLRF